MFRSQSKRKTILLNSLKKETITRRTARKSSSSSSSSRKKNTNSKTKKLNNVAVIPSSRIAGTRNKRSSLVEYDAAMSSLLFDHHHSTNKQRSNISSKKKHSSNVTTHRTLAMRKLTSNKQRPMTAVRTKRGSNSGSSSSNSSSNTSSVRKNSLGKHNSNSKSKSNQSAPVSISGSEVPTYRPQMSNSSSSKLGITASRPPSSNGKVRLNSSHKGGNINHVNPKQQPSTTTRTKRAEWTVADEISMRLKKAHHRGYYSSERKHNDTSHKIARTSIKVTLPSASMKSSTQKKIMNQKKKPLLNTHHTLNKSLMNQQQISNANNRASKRILTSSLKQRPGTATLSSRTRRDSTSSKDSHHSSPFVSSSSSAAIKRRRAITKGLKLKDLSLSSLLGEGAFSRVYLCHLKDERKQQELGCDSLAMKVVPLNRVQSMAGERKILSQLNHPSIVRFHGSFTDTQAGAAMFLLDFAVGGEILHYLELTKHGRFDWETSKFYLAQLIDGLSYLHNQCIVYRDLKPENCLLDSNGHLKIVDFGFARYLDESQNERCFTLCGSREYVAPELLIGQGYDYSVDIWSLGVMAYEMLSSHLPFDVQQCPPTEVLNVIQQTRISLPPFIPRIARDFILRLLIIDPDQRLGCYSDGKRRNGKRKYSNISVLKKHPCFDGIIWDDISKQNNRPPIQPDFKDMFDGRNYQNARFEDGTNDFDRAFQVIEKKLKKDQRMMLDSHF